MNENYYAQKLNSQKLHQVYETKIERVKRYLDAEIRFVAEHLSGNEKILELGAGYGRIMKELAPHAGSILGIDISASSVALGKEYLKDVPNCRIEVLDAHDVDCDSEFDVVLGLQNALSALKGSAPDVVRRAVGALVPGGKAFFSTYSPRFWLHRLEWFQEQAEKGLLGEIDPEKTRDGLIVCRDGFTATTFTAKDLEQLALEIGCVFHISEVDESSLFLILEKGT